MRIAGFTLLALCSCLSLGCAGSTSKEGAREISYMRECFFKDDFLAQRNLDALQARLESWQTHSKPFAVCGCITESREQPIVVLFAFDDTRHAEKAVFSWTNASGLPRHVECVFYHDGERKSASPMVSLISKTQLVPLGDIEQRFSGRDTLSFKLAEPLVLPDGVDVIGAIVDGNGEMSNYVPITRHQPNVPSSGTSLPHAGKQ